MSIDFNQVINRQGTNSLKWDDYTRKFPGFATDGALPMWVADGDIKAPAEVTELLVAKAKFGIYGYPKSLGKEFAAALQGWLKSRHNFQIEKEWVVFSPGVVPAIAVAIQTFTNEGDGVIIQPPVYYPFRLTVEDNNRKVVNNPLVYQNGHYSLDFADLEAKAKDPKNKLLIFCSPHNPVGRVWTEEELKKIKEICLANDVLLFSDEIHADLALFGHKHIPLAALGAEYAKGTITAYAASKTFNLAGLQASSVVISDKDLRQQFNGWFQKAGLEGCGNIFGAEATICAYRTGAEYVDQLVRHIEGNVNYVETFLAKELPTVSLVKPEGTYLVWLDFNRTGFSPAEIDKKIVEQAKVLGDFGWWFGEEGRGFNRLNLACPRQTVESAMQSLKKALQS